MGTIVKRGSGRGVVVATGSATAFGQIAVGLGERQAETAFQVGLRDFSKLLVGVAAVLTISIFVINVAYSRPLIDALLFSLAIAIGITPQLLPAIVSVSLSTGARELARKRVLVKRLVTIEDLGNIEMLVHRQDGDAHRGGDHLRPGAGSVRAAGARAADPRARLQRGRPHGLRGGRWQRARCRAVVLGTRRTRSPRRPRAHAATRRLGILPFDHERQLVSVAVRGPDGASYLVTKGAPEVVLARCACAYRRVQRQTLDRLFAEGTRVVAVGNPRVVGAWRAWQPLTSMTSGSPDS